MNNLSSVKHTMVFDRKLGRCVERKRRKPRKQTSPALIGPTDVRPQISNSSGVLPSQVDEARRVIKEHGLTGVDVRPDGLVVSTCRGKRGKSGINGWMSVRGHTDFDGGYNDV